MRSILFPISVVAFVVILLITLAYCADKAGREKGVQQVLNYDSEYSKEQEKLKKLDYFLSTNKLYQMENDQFAKFQKAFDISPTYVEKQKYLDSMEVSLKKSMEISRNLKLIYEEIYNKPNPTAGSD